ncbi:MULTISPECIES: hypothetical protein [Bradyrhizobium]|uniref:hypothetical protein n=1 Tax=Bradyrhizobium TaxID=374 RepID=UPI0004820CC6|nr:MULTISPECIES: hypothetical protein [Bradyrhizobium]MCS3450513.1 hypothetical protein [Bradyrhizobium elkanii]MCS3558342.1 hypothetical protein [Bradyrhizobium elkanii]MCW2151811.1 hypothetical protein [Bradyrhizobium elkanii]MCW2358316.1 hypothetical protein [Bradyrhizobium elkanii]MCW2375542.1 hypothetical protein [Bradyrhizobium elkanii]
MRISSQLAAILLLSLPLAGCLTSDDGGGPTTFTDDRGVANQPFPDRYRDQILAFMRTYLNNPVGVREAVIAEPAQRTIGGRLRYVVCLRYSAKDTDGNYRPARERGVLFVDGRLDRILDNPAEPCAGASYAAFPELEKMSR